MADPGSSSQGIKSEPVAPDTGASSHHALPSYEAHTAPIDTSHLVPEPSSHPPTKAARIPSGATIPDPDAVEEDGRTWQAYRENSYYLPNDAEEQDRLDMQHALYRMLLNGALYWAPLRTEPAHVLDIGTGTGIWAMNFAQEHPASNVVGTDLSLIQPKHIAPDNLTFIREDAEDAWTLNTKFDFIHLRLMLTCFNDHKAVIRKIWDNLNPGGFVEYHDASLEISTIDDSLRGTNMERWLGLIKAGGAALRRNFNVAYYYKNWLIEAGFVDVYEHLIPVPGNPWPIDRKQKRIGRIAGVDFCGFVQGISLKILQHGLGMSVPEIEELVALVHKDIKNTNIHWFGTVFVVYGRKPYIWEYPPSQVISPSTVA